MFAEDAILFSEIVNHIYLVAIHPARNSEHEELQRMGHRERLLGRDTWHRTARNDSPGLGRFFAPYEGSGQMLEFGLHFLRCGDRVLSENSVVRFHWRRVDG